MHGSGSQRRALVLAALVTAWAAEPARAQERDAQERDDDREAGDDAETAAEVIVITESRRERPLAETTVATEVITRETIEDSGAENLAELLETHPGVEVFRSFRGSAIRMQGLDPDYVLVLVDGERAIGRVGGAIDLARFPIEDIERVEIVKGASSALYGSDALAGVINIITRRSQRPDDRPFGAELHASYGQLGTLDLSGRAGLARGDWTSNTTLGWHQSDGYDLEPETIATTASAYDEIHATHRTTYRPVETLELIARAEYLLRDQQGIDESATGAVFDRATRTEIASASLSSKWRPVKSGVLSVRGTYSLWRDQYLSDQRDSDALDTFEITREQLVEVETQYDAAITSKHFLTAGVEGMVELLASDRLSEGGDRTRLALFGQHEWTIASDPYIVAAPGFRLDVDSQFGVHASPKLAARWDIHEKLALRASYGMGYRAPSFRELLLFFENPGVGYRVEGNPDLAPETSRSANVGLEARAHRKVWASLNVFHNDIDDLIATDLLDDGGTDGPQVFGYVNIASARTQGVETLLRVSPVEDLTLQVGYTLTDTLDRETGMALPGRAMHRGTFQASYEIPIARLAFSARGSLHGAQSFYRGEEEIRTAPYASIDARMAARVVRYLELFAGVHNALDAGDPQLIPIPPRTFYGGLTARY